MVFARRLPFDDAWREKSGKPQANNNVIGLVGVYLISCTVLGSG